MSACSAPRASGHAIKDARAYIKRSERNFAIDMWRGDLRAGMTEVPEDEDVHRVAVDALDQVSDGRVLIPVDAYERESLCCGPCDKWRGGERNFDATSLEAAMGPRCVGDERTYTRTSRSTQPRIRSDAKYARAAFTGLPLDYLELDRVTARPHTRGFDGRAAPSVNYGADVGRDYMRACDGVPSPQGFARWVIASIGASTREEIMELPAQLADIACQVSLFEETKAGPRHITLATRMQLGTREQARKKFVEVCRFLSKKLPLTRLGSEDAAQRSSFSTS